MDISTLLVFIITSLILIASPGPDMILVMSRSVTFGKKAGLVTALGVSVGLVGHTILATLGIGAILNSSIILFTILKFVGAMYLIYIAYKTYKAPAININIKQSDIISTKQLFLQGAISNITNPKIVIFYFSFLPQFIPLKSENPTLLLFSLGILFAILTFLLKAPIALGASHFSTFIRNNKKIQSLINKISAFVLFSLGVKLAFESKN